MGHASKKIFKKINVCLLSINFAILEYFIGMFDCSIRIFYCFIREYRSNTADNITWKKFRDLPPFLKLGGALKPLASLSPAYLNKFLVKRTFAPKALSRIRFCEQCMYQY